MSIFDALLFALLSIGCWRLYKAENPSCIPVVRDETFTEFMKNMNCEVDEDLLRLFSSAVFNNYIVKNPYSNFMCIGLMDALGLVPENLCDAYDPLSEIPDADFCSSTKIATLRKIVNSSVFDNHSNIFIVSKFTEEHCEALCSYRDDTNQLCWAFGIITGAVFKHTISTQATTTVPTTTVPTTTASQLSTVSVLPAVVSQSDDVVSDGDVDKASDKADSNKGGSDNHTDKPENTSDKNVTIHFDKVEISNNSESVSEMPDTNDEAKESKAESNDHIDKPEDNHNATGTTEELEDLAQYFDRKNDVHESISSDGDDDGNVSGKGGHEDNESKDTDTEEDLDKGPTEIVATLDQDYHVHEVNDNVTHPIGDVQTDDNQTLDDTDQAADLDGQGLGGTYQDDHTDQTFGDNDPVNGKDVLSTSTTAQPTQATATAYLADDYDYNDYDDYSDYDDGNGYQYLIAIVLFIFLLVVAEHFARQKVLIVLPSSAIVTVTIVWVHNSK